MASTKSSSGVDELTALLSILSTSVSAMTKEQPNFPSLYETTPQPPSPPTPEIMLAVQAAKQLLATLDPLYAVGAAVQIHTPACLRVAIESHVVEAIREGEASPGQGLHVNEIAKFSVIDPKKLSRVLRLLASQHFFREVSLDTFTNTRTTIAFDTGKAANDLKNTKSFYENTTGVAAVLAHTAEDIGKGSVYLPDTLLDPKTSHSYSPTECAYSTAFKIDVPCFVHMGADKAKVDRFGSAMRFFSVADAGNGHILRGFNWKSLPENAVVADVGGGVGTVSLVLARELPKSVRIYLQDRPEVISGEAKAVWEKENPEDVAAGRVVLQAHDFLTPQTVPADVYLMRAIIHDWPDAEAVKILVNLKAVAKPTTRVIIVDQLVGTLYPSETSPALPFPLLATPEFVYKVDLQMMVALNAQERTRAEFEDLAVKSGWVVEEVHPSLGGVGFAQVVLKLA